MKCWEQTTEPGHHVHPLSLGFDEFFKRVNILREIGLSMAAWTFQKQRQYTCECQDSRDK